MFVRDEDTAGDVASRMGRVFSDRFGSNLKVCPCEVHETVSCNLKPLSISAQMPRPAPNPEPSCPFATARSPGQRR
jgi:hypothetical protein